MYDEPARPSPTPAPIAPPARARPPPTKAPASLTASAVSVAAISLLGWAPGRCRVISVVRVLLVHAPTGVGRSVRKCGGLLVVVLVLDHDGVRSLGVAGTLLVVLVLVVVMPGAGHREVDDGQQGEDEGLDEADEHVEP